MFLPQIFELLDQGYNQEEILEMSGITEEELNQYFVDLTSPQEK